MRRTLSNIYRAILTRYDRDPRKSDNAAKLGSFCGQMYQDQRQNNTNESGGSGADYVDGVHYHAVVTIPPIDKRRCGIWSTVKYLSTLMRDWRPKLFVTVSFWVLQASESLGARL
jgi:hypothetical protein